MAGRPRAGASRALTGGATLERLILDTTILIAAERSLTSIDEVLGDDDDVAIAAVTAAELLVGVELSDGRRKAARRAFVDWVVATIPVEPYDLPIARIHAELLAGTRRSGRTRGAHDLLIAATARGTARTVLSADASGFEDLPGVVVRRLPETR